MLAMLIPIHTRSHSTMDDVSCTNAPALAVAAIPMIRQARYRQAPMERHYRLERAYLKDGWRRDVGVAVDEQGRITRIETDHAQTAGVPAASHTAAASQAAADSRTLTAAERVAGFVVPGVPNAHSHAFQRGMAGNTEYRLSSRDSFWTWRQAMYALARRITPPDLELIATQLFVEMLKAGYTSVAEFHYLHRQSDGTAYAATNELWDAIARAADTAGIGLP